MTKRLRLVGMALLFCVFASASIAKIFAFDQLEDMLKVSHLLPDALVYTWVPILAGFVVVWEMVVAVTLLIPHMRITALWAACSTLLVFAAYAIVRQIKGINAPCSCFGSLFKMSPFTSLGLCVALLAVAIAVLTSYSTPMYGAILTGDEHFDTEVVC